MFIGNFGTNEDGRAQLLVGITPTDLMKVLQAGGQIDVNEDEDPDNPLPVRMILMVRETEADVEQAIEDAIDRAKEDAYCDHDWEDVGDGTVACTYPDCGATRTKEAANGEDDV